MTTRLIDHLTASSSKKKKPAIILGLEGGYQLNPNADGGSLQDAVLQTIRPFCVSIEYYLCATNYNSDLGAEREKGWGVR